MCIECYWFICSLFYKVWEMQYIQCNTISLHNQIVCKMCLRVLYFSVRIRVDQCGEMVTQTLLNSTMCMNQLERQQVMASSKDIFGGYDRICAHRTSLSWKFRFLF